MFKNILKNTFWVTLFGIAGRIIIAATYFLIARYLGVAMFGNYNMAIAYVAVFTVFAEIGTRTFFIRELVRAPDKIKIYLGNIIFLIISFSALIFCIMLLTARWLGYSDSLIKLIMILGVSMILNAIKNIYIYGLYDALGHFNLSALVDTGLSILHLILIMLAFFLKLGIEGIVFFCLVSSIAGLSAVILVSFVKKLGSPIIEFKSIKEMLIKITPFFLDAFFGLCYYRVGILMLSSMATVTDVGLYSSAGKVIDMVAFIPFTFNRCLSPILYRIGPENLTHLKNIYNMVSKYVIIVGIALASILFLLARPVITFLYGQQYSGSIILLMILTILLPFRILTISLGRFIIAADKIKKGMIIMGIGLVISIILHIRFILRYGVIGAAVATVIADIVLTIMAYILIFNTFRMCTLTSKKTNQNNSSF